MHDVTSIERMNPTCESTAMGLEFRWVGEDDLDRVALTRLRCYATIDKELEIYQQRIREDRRAKPGDFLLAEHDGAPIGTATSLSMTMWVRGAPIPCQGVAWVGTVKTHRRRTSDPAERGIASKIMQETLRKGRERGQVISALMPFRASFYEHFGYGLVERQNEWTLPLCILPTGDCSGIEFMKPDDLPAMKQCQQRMTQSGQCDMEWSDASWEYWMRRFGEGFCVVDRDGPTVHSWLHIIETPQPGQTRLLRIGLGAWDSPDALLRQLHFLASLRDQYAAATWMLPADLALNRLLKETQVPHRPVSHATASMMPQTRMQVRILDHVRFLEALHLPTHISGRMSVLVEEPEGDRTALSIEIELGHAAVKPGTGDPQVTCTASVWASIVCGDFRPDPRIRLSGFRCADSATLTLLNAFSDGPAPFCTEYF
jgi:hypothetical protein